MLKNNRPHHNWVLFKQKKEVETASTNSSLLVPHGGNGAPYNQYRCDHDGDDDDDDDDYDDDDNDDHEDDDEDEDDYPLIFLYSASYFSRHL